MKILEDRRQFFEDLKTCYSKEGQKIPLAWEEVAGRADMDSMLFYMAFNLSKCIFHGPLPDHLHNRMVLSDNEWTKNYFRYLGDDQWTRDASGD